MATTTLSFHQLNLSLTATSATTITDAARSRLRGRILLKSRNSLLLLCPLLPLDKPKHALAMPEEIWRRILEMVMMDIGDAGGAGSVQAAMPSDLLRTCTAFKFAASPTLYANPALRSQSSLLAFRDTLVKADQRWDALRRIHYSTPGRWVTSLDLSSLALSSITSRLAIDTALTQIFSLTPFLTHLRLHPKITLSRRAFKSLQESCGRKLKCVTGLGIPDVVRPSAGWSDPVTEFLMWTPNIEELEVVGGGFGDIDEDDELPEAPQNRPNDNPLPLRKLSLIAIPLSPVYVALLDRVLPNLTHLTMTSYHSEAVDDQVAAAHALGLPVANGGPGLIGGFPGPQPQFVPTDAAATSLFLQTHGSNLISLTLLAAPDWPPIPFTPPQDILVSCPRLRHLGLLSEKNSTIIRLDLPTQPHPLTDVTLSRPNDDLLSSLDTALRTNASKANKAPSSVNRSCPIANTRAASLLPNLATVKFTSVRWLKLTSRGALNAGTSGGMRQWKGTMRRYGVRVVDMDGAEA